MTIPLQSAFLCVNCDHIGPYSHVCAKCGEVHGLLSVSAVLNRVTQNLPASNKGK